MEGHRCRITAVAWCSHVAASRRLAHCGPAPSVAVTREEPNGPAYSPNDSAVPQACAAVHWRSEAQLGSSSTRRVYSR